MACMAYTSIAMLAQGWRLGCHHKVMLLHVDLQLAMLR